MKLTTENCSRKIDSTGRLVIPKGLRDRLGIIEGDSVDFYFLEDGDKRYICVTKDEEIKDRKRERVRELCIDLGIEVPEDLYD